MKVNVGSSLRGRKPARVALSTVSFACERYEYKHIRWDPKDGDLCLNRVKPGETLVEARSDTDVQIVRLI
jgi:hypothetical protein